MASPFDEVMRVTNLQIKALEKWQTELERQFNLVKSKPADRVVLLEIIPKQQRLVAEAIETLGSLTTAQIDSSGEMPRIASALTKISGDLRSKTDTLEAFGIKTRILGDVLTEIDGITKATRAFSGPHGTGKGWDK